MTVGPVVRDPATAEFFDGTAAAKFLLRKCPAGHFSEPAAVQCTSCATTELRWEPAGGGASLVSWAVAWSPATADGEPVRTVLVIGELDEGPWWWSQLADGSPDALAVGQRLRIEFRRASAEHEAVPVFVLA
ncbi:MAG: OB-fold domain-containing protein [Actinobacteria bacterium]|nr:OB-fold domain-containing protein [Actinomycetota bacterium]MBO0834110.1 OB-fold domain-containing protein [Actinomycetota bacterium]